MLKRHVRPCVCVIYLREYSVLIGRQLVHYNIHGVSQLHLIHTFTCCMRMKLQEPSEVPCLCGGVRAYLPSAFWLATPDDHPLTSCRGHDPVVENCWQVTRDDVRLKHLASFQRLQHWTQNIHTASAVEQIFVVLQYVASVYLYFVFWSTS